MDIVNRRSTEGVGEDSGRWADRNAGARGWQAEEDRLEKKEDRLKKKEALLSSGLLSSLLLYSTLIYSSILHHTILCICTLREPWAECPRILLQFSYNVHRKNNTRQSAQEFSSNYLITYIGKTTQHLAKELPECIPKTSKIPPKPPPKTP